MAMNEVSENIYLNPLMPVTVIAPLFGVVFILLVVMMIVRGQSKKHVVFTGLRVFLLLALAFIINLRPMHAGDEAGIETRNLDVLFVVDTTISMWAQDYNGTAERMDGVMQDCQYIMESLAGANFGLIRFDNRGQILAPFTQDVRNVSDALDTIRSPDRDYAKGSDLSVVYKQMEELLISSNAKEDRQTIVFFISDGEMTNDAELISFSPLAHLVDGGAVLGYGTEAGGRMQEGAYNSYVYDPQTGQAAVSKIDEANLQKIAADLGVDYLYMDRPQKVDATVAYVRLMAKATVSEAKIVTFDDTYFYYAIPLLALLLLELARMILYRKL